MANQDIKQPGSLSVLTKTGIQDIAVITQTRAWFKLNGVNGIFGRLERLNGKRLSFALSPDRVVSLHSNNQGQLFVQTDKALLLYKESDLASDEIIADEDSSVVIDDGTGEHLINA